MQSAKSDTTNSFLGHLRGEDSAGPAGVRYHRRARTLGGPIEGPVEDWAAGILDRPVPGAAPRRFANQARRATGGRARSRLIGRTGLAALGLVLILVATAAAASLPTARPATAAKDGSALAAFGVSQTPSPSPSDSPSPDPQTTPSGRVGNPIAGSAFLTYTVKAGDTLIRIANSFELSATTVYWANQTTISDPQLVKIGQTLLIPPLDGLVMVAATGDTLQSIADKYGISTQVIVDANSLTDPNLTPGELLIVPGAPTGPLPTPAKPGATPKPPNWLNKLEWPVPGHHRLTLLFGCVKYVGEVRFHSCPHYHAGLDVGAPTGTPVVAAAAGTVIYSGWKRAGTDGSGGGIVVWISHGGTLYTTYNHLSAVTVKAGQHVTANQRVGYVGATGAASGSHLHFEVWIEYPWTGGDVSGARNPLLYTKFKP